MTIQTSHERLKLEEPVYRTGWVILNANNTVWHCELFKTPKDAHRYIQTTGANYQAQWPNLKVVKGKATFEPIVHSTLSTVSIAREIVEEAPESVKP